MSQWLESCVSAKMNVPVDGFEVELVRHEKAQDSGKRQRRPSHAMDEMGPTSDIFRGLRIGVQHEEDAALVVRGGGKVMRYDSDSLTFEGVPTHVVLDHGYQKLAARGTCVSRKWLSSCLMVNALLPVDSNRLYSPITSKLPIAKMDQMKITVSGFYVKTPDGFPLRGSLAALIRLLGANFSERMARKSTTQLICESASGDKYARARDWGIPCLSVDWLYSCADHGRVVETLPFIVRTDATGSAEKTVGDSTSDVHRGGIPSTSEDNGSAKLLISLTKKSSSSSSTKKHVMSVRATAAQNATKNADDSSRTLKVSELDSILEDGEQQPSAELSQAQMVTYKANPKKRARRDSSEFNKSDSSPRDKELTQNSY
uniref:BRCT domain-containing protein n=2 Tax=Rhodosorus marinus TaxID=101924 RepID=A0A7S0G5Q6_9RHOD|mmetsp:Transcript_9174/g.13429  ORF Transcript_9174/g.13429 Transcript_9174/m.13429 type:complete len:372 (+) Transcript_9174:1328-2443(+)